MKQLTKILTIFIFANFLFLSAPQEIKANFFDLGKAATQAGYKESEKNPFTPIGKVIGAILNFLGVIFLILMIYGGFMWMTAAGNEEQVGKAQKIITAAIIGLVIVASAYAITALVGTQIINPTVGA